MALVQRPLRGSRISTFYPVKNLPSLSSLDSAFQLQEYISLLIRLDVHDVDAIVSIPGRAGKQKEKESNKEGESADDTKEKSVNVDEACWKYEQLRRLAQDLSHPLITMLQQVCTRTTCPEMKAGEWLYLCVAHGNDGAMEQCCAIDYILHTLDSATALLNSPRAFPSRLQIPPASHRHFTSLARRLGRIFAHAYFHHREEFEQAEAESSLYARFLALTEKFDLVPADFLVIPPRAVASSSEERRGSMVPAVGLDVPPPTLLGASLHVDTTSPSSEDGPHQEQSASPPGLEGADAMSPQSASRRHGRSRTDTMMHEGEGRFPVSPATAPADDGEGPTGLDAALAAAGVGMLASAPAPEAVEPPQTQTQDSAPITQESAPEPVIVQVPDASHGEAQEMPSPTSDEETGGAGERERERGPVVSPSSSTAPQAETHPITSMLEREEVSGAPGTPPPAVDEEGNKAEAEVEADEPVAEVAESVDQIGGKEGEGEKKEEEVQAQDISEGTKGVTDSEPSAAAEETSAPAKPVSEPEPAPVAATEELDVTETQKDAAEPAKPEAELEAGKAE